MSMAQNFEQQVSDIKIPEIDVHDRVTAAISSRKNKKNIVHPKLLIAAVISLLFIVGTGFASVKIINLYNEQGEQWVSIQPFNEENAKPETTTRGVSDYYLTLIEEGEAIAVYHPDNNKDQVVYVRSKPVEYRQWDKLVNDSRHSFSLPSSLSDKFDFQFAIIHRAAVEPNKDSLIEESRTNGNKVTYEKLKLLEEVLAVTLNFIIGDYNYTVTMSEGRSWETVYTDLFHNVGSQKLKVSGIDGFLTTDEYGTKMLWRSSDEMGDVFFDVSTSNTSPHVAEELTSLLNQLAAGH